MPRLRRGFTLVELLVVIAIIGILMALLFPAINSVREAARQTQCKNNLSQIGKGCLNHRTAWGFFPTGGWGWRWAGDPDRGFTLLQPSGWMFNLLPYIGEEELHDMGKGQTDAKKRALGVQRVARVLPLYCCPSRRRADTYPYTHDSPYYNIDRPTVVGRNDYAANSGDMPQSGSDAGPPTLAEGDKKAENDWNNQATGIIDPNDLNKKRYLAPTGIMYLRSMVKAVDDGDSCTYLAGEKHLNIARYDTSDADNDQGWDLGYDIDTNRWTSAQPYEDDNVTRTNSFGSVHSGGCYMVFCDAHVDMISYDIDPEIHRQLGNRKDGYPTDVTKAH